MFKKLLIVILLSPFWNAHSQLVTGTSMSPLALVQNVLLGQGVTVSNILYNGSPVALGSFQSTNTVLGIDEGIVLTTGTVVDNGSGPQGPNNQSGAGEDNNIGGSALLSGLIGSTQTYNAAILEFDFIPYSDTVRFKYVFGSDEYPEFAPPNNSGFNDVFGFFISGPGIPGIQNIAQLPNGGGVVSINNVNINTNSQYFNFNGNGNMSPYDSDPMYIQYDGFTDVLEAVSQVQCGQTYHLVIAIADVGDGGWDSGIFLEANSLSSLTPVDITYELSNQIYSEPNWIAEGCVTATVTLERDANLGSSLTVPIDVSGTATDLLDYSGIPGSITFNPGDAQVSFTIDVVLDGIAEGQENIVLDFPLSDPCGNITPVTIELFIQDIEELSVDINNPEVSCPGENIILTTTVSGGVSPYTYLWSDNSTQNNISIVPTSTGEYYVEVTDDCLNQTAYDTVVVSVPEYDPITLTTSSDIVVICPNISQYIQTTALGGTGNYIYEWTDASNQIISTLDSAYISPDYSTFFVVHVSDECGTFAVDTLNYTVTSPPLEVYGSPTAYLCPGDSTFISVQASGGFGSYHYYWPHSGDTINQIWVTPFSTSNYQVQVSDDCQTFSVSATIQVVVVKPDANFTIISEPVVENLPIAFQNLTTNGYVYQWYFGDGGYSEDVHPNHVYDAPGMYQVTLIATDSKGCIDSITLPIQINKEFYIYIPNAFIPDGDRFNEVFSGSFIGVKEIKMEIYNRWGQMLFSSTDLNFEWDGTYKGEKVQNGTYVWKLIYLPEDRVDREFYTGHVTVLD